MRLAFFRALPLCILTDVKDGELLFPLLESLNEWMFEGLGEMSLSPSSAKNGPYVSRDSLECMCPYLVLSLCLLSDSFLPSF